jgi:hypothetical protein
MDTLRKLYQRAVCIPLDNIEQIWKEYDSFEHQMSKMTVSLFFPFFLPYPLYIYSILTSRWKSGYNIDWPSIRPRNSLRISRHNI